MNGHNGTVQILLENRADANIHDKDCWTPLHLASRNGHDGTVQILLKNRADANIQDEDCLTPLHLASMNGHNGTVQILLENRADANIQDEDSRCQYSRQGLVGLHFIWHPGMDMMELFKFC
jgi:serine/threonine-protein phosphatase 6 regulatory ankyrin repeat subunit B